MAHVRKDTLSAPGEWAKHLRPYGKRLQSKAERQAAKKVVINEITEDPCDLLLNGKYVGTITSDIQMYDVRLQIAEKGLEGYSVRFNGEDIPIDKKGMVSRWPAELFGKTVKYCAKILRLQNPVRGQAKHAAYLDDKSF